MGDFSTREGDSFPTLAASVGSLLRASGPVEVVRAAARFASEQLRAPVAGWLDASADTRGSLVAAHGFGTESSRALRQSMRLVEQWPRLTDGERRRIRKRFAQIAGAPDAIAVNSGVALLLLATPPDFPRRWTRALGSILEDSLSRAHTVDVARRREAQLDMGLAWTAHELRGPLLSARMAMDQALEGYELDRELASMARHQLDALAGMVDGLLRWSVGARSLRRNRVSLVRLVHEAVDAVTVGVAEDRARISAPGSVLVAGDSDLLRAAIGNLVRNALAYSSDEDPVLVAVDRRNGTAVVSVADQGPGIPEEERDSIFDPFVRGKAGRGSNGGGLGLFIVQRVAQAHGGTVRLDPGPTGTTFRFEIPACR